MSRRTISSFQRLSGTVHIQPCIVKSVLEADRFFSVIIMEGSRPALYMTSVLEDGSISSTIVRKGSRPGRKTSHTCQHTLSITQPRRAKESVLQLRHDRLEWQNEEFPGKCKNLNSEWCFFFPLFLSLLKHEYPRAAIIRGKKRKENMRHTARLAASCSLLWRLWWIARRPFFVFCFCFAITIHNLHHKVWINKFCYEPAGRA